MGHAPSVERSSITIVVADDHAVVRDGLRLLLDAESDMQVLAESDDADGTLRAIRTHRPDVLLLDLVLLDGNGLDTLPAVAQEAPDTAVVVLTMHKDAAVARQALRAGASGFVLKDAAGTELVRAIRAVAGGSVYVQPEIGGLIAALDHAGPNLLDQISEREVEVLRLVALGHTSREIADMLILSVRTVESHRAHLQGKLGCASRAELVRYALDHGLLGAD
jgi:two-component system, NarL family, response regulator NreC